MPVILILQNPFPSCITTVIIRVLLPVVISFQWE